MTTLPMSLPEAGSLEALSPGELRDLVGTLVAEVRRLQAENVALRAENQALRDEVARPKGLARSAKASRPKRRRGAKCGRDAIPAEIVVKATVPAGSRFKGYEDSLARELHLSAEVIRYRRER